MKKFLCALLALGMTLATAFSAAACGGKGGDNGDISDTLSSSQGSESVEESSEESDTESGEESSESSNESSEDDEPIFIPDYTGYEDLQEQFNGRVGEITYNTGKDLTINSLPTDSPIYLGAYSEDNLFTVDGGADFDRTLTVIGYGGGVVQMNGGTLVLRNLTIRNATDAYGANGYRDYYAEFGGRVRFENCTIDCSIQLRNDAEAEFIDCEIKSIAADMYSVWVADGSARFEGCTFTGYRALKVHEIMGMDVINVAVEDCFFDSIEKKPAIAIDIAEEVSTTTITFINCEMLSCAPWTRDSLEGVDGFYESDTDTTTFLFFATNCTLDYQRFDFSDGEIVWQED